MAPGSNERHPPPPPQHTGTVPKTKIRNCVVPQEAVTPTRRDINSTNHASTSLDWVAEPVSEYNSRGNYIHSSRNNNRADQEFSDLDNSVSLQRLVPVRPQPRGLPLPTPTSDVTHTDETLHHYQHPTANGVSPHANHSTAAIMIVNPTTPNTVSGNMTQPFNVPTNSNRNNLARAFHSARNSMEAPPGSGRSTKSNNLTSNVYEPPAHHDPTHGSGGSLGGAVGESSALGDAMVAACPDPASVERRLGQIREYIRVTSSLVDTMRNSEDEAYIEHTKEEYDELVEMVMKLKESETKLIHILDGSAPDNNEVLTEDEDAQTMLEVERPSSTNPFLGEPHGEVVPTDTTANVSVAVSNSTNIESTEEGKVEEHLVELNRDIEISSSHLVKKISNVENEQLNKSNEKLNQPEPTTECSSTQSVISDNTDMKQESDFENSQELIHMNVAESIDCLKIIELDANDTDHKVSNPGSDPNELLKKNILSCNEKLAVMEALRESKLKEAEQQRPQEQGGGGGGERAMRFCKLLDHLTLAGADTSTNNLPQAPTNYHESSGVARPMSVQSNGSAYSDNELWQNELKAKMEVSQQRLAALQDQQKRLLKYQAEAKQQLAEMHSANRTRQPHDNQLVSSPPPPPASHTAHHHAQMFATHPQPPGRPHRSNQIGVATTLPHSMHSYSHHHAAVQLNVSAAAAAAAAESYRESHQPDHRYLLQNTNNMLPHLEGSGGGAGGGSGGGGGGSDEDEDEEAAEEHEAAEREAAAVAAGAGRGGEGLLSQHGRELQHKLRDLQRKKQHMENLVAEFQKLQEAEQRVSGGSAAGAGAARGAGGAGAAGGGGGGAHNTYCSSPDDSEEEDSPPRKCNQSDVNMKNEDPFKLMEISAIKAALQKTKDLMRSVERYEPPDSEGLHEDSYPGPSHSNINDNNSEGTCSAGGRSVRSVRSVHNSIQPAGKLTNQHAGTGAHDASITSLQLLAQQLRQEAENISHERQRLKHSLSHNKEGGGKFSQKRVNVGGSGGGTSAGARGGSPGPLERKQAVLRAELAEKQRQLEAILNKEKELSSTAEVQNVNADLCSYSAMNHSYNSEQDEGDLHAEEVMFPAHANTQPDHLMYRSAGSSLYGEGGAGAEAGASAGLLPPPRHQLPAYCSDSDNGSRGKSSQRSSRGRRPRPPPPELLAHQHGAGGSGGGGGGGAAGEPREPSALAPPPHTTHTGESSSSTTPYPVPPPLSSPRPPPQHHHPLWTNKSNQDARTNQFTQNSHSQTMDRLLGQQLPPFPHSVPFNMMMPYGVMGGGACGCGWWGPWCWQQLTSQQREIHQLREQLNSLEERWRAESAPHALNNQVAPGNRANNYWDNFRSYSRQNLLSANSKTNADGHLWSVQPHNPHPLVERSHNTLHPAAAGVASPPVNTPKRNLARGHTPAVAAAAAAATSGAVAGPASATPDVLNVNRQAAAEPLQSNSHNLNTKRKSSSKLPAKNSSNRRNCGLHFLENANINIAGARSSEPADPNLASTSRDDKATSKLFDLLRENVYSEVTALISANESHPDFLIQLFRDLQRVSSDTLRHHALQSIRDVLSRAAAPTDSNEISSTDTRPVPPPRDDAALVYTDIIDFMIVRGDEICSPDILEMFKSVIVRSHREAGHSMPFSHKRLQEFLCKYEGLRLRDVSGDIVDNLSVLLAADEPQLQDVAGSLSVYGAGAGHSQLLQLDAGAAWPAGGGGEVAGGGGGGGGGGRERGESEARADLMECAEMHNGDLAEADQACPGEPEPPADVADVLPDLVDTEEPNSTEAEAEWLGLDRVPTRLHNAGDDSSASQQD